MSDRAVIIIVIPFSNYARYVDLAICSALRETYASGSGCRQRRRNRWVGRRYGREARRA
jgi:hypothetical protein